MQPPNWTLSLFFPSLFHPLVCSQSDCFKFVNLSHACMLSCFSHVWLFATLWTIAHQAPLSMGFSRQEYWSGLPCPPAGDLPDPETESESPASPALPTGSLPMCHQGRNLCQFCLNHPGAHRLYAKAWSFNLICEILCQDLANIFWRGQMVNILDLGAHRLCSSPPRPHGAAGG